jgi:hypothetical protein
VGHRAGLDTEATGKIVSEDYRSEYMGLRGSKDPGENYITKSFKILNLNRLLLG